MRSMSKTQLIATAGADPEIRMTTTNKVMAQLSVATNETYTDKDTQEKKEITEWHRIVFFGKLAEIVRDYVHKGQLLYIEGSNKTRSYEIDGELKRRYITEVVAKEMQILSPKGTKKSAKIELDAPVDLDAPPF